MKAALVLGVLIAASPAAAAEPANTLPQLYKSLSQCLTAHGLALHSGSTITLRFSLKRDGSLNGKPRIAYSKLPDNEDDRKQDADSIASTFDACVPLAITTALGGAIAGQPLNVTLSARRPDQGT